MSDISRAPDIGALEIPIDTWTKPFWDGAGEGKLLLPRCADCRKFRWPPGPFCPHCQSQKTEWCAAGRARIYSFVVLRDGDPPHVPALIEFPDQDGIRIVAAIIDTPIEAIRIGADVTVAWSAAANAQVPVFKI